MKRSLIMVLVLLALVAGCMRQRAEAPGGYPESKAMFEQNAPMAAPAAASGHVVEVVNGGEAPFAPPAESERAAQPAKPVPVNETAAAVKPKIIRNAKFTIKSENLKADLALIDAKITELKGYVSSSSEDLRSEINRTAHLTARIPAERLDEFMKFLDARFKVEGASTNSEDVTMQYVDLSARVKVMKEEEAGLAQLLSRTANLQNALDVRRELAAVRERIESVEGQLRYYDNKVGLSTVDIDLRQEKAIEEVKSSWWSEFTEGLRTTILTSLATLGRSLQALVYFVVAVLPWAIAGIVIVYPLAKLVRRLRKGKEKKAAPTPPVIPPGN